MGELAVAFDKYEREGLQDAKQVMVTFLEETKRLGTSRAAECLDLESTGTLARGFRADMMVLGDHSKDTRALASENVAQVIKRGMLLEK